MASSKLLLPAPVSPVMAKRPAERRGSAVKSMVYSPAREVMLQIVMVSIVIWLSYEECEEEKVGKERKKWKKYDQRLGFVEQLLSHFEALQ